MNHNVDNVMPVLPTTWRKGTDSLKDTHYEASLKNKVTL